LIEFDYQFLWNYLLKKPDNQGVIAERRKAMENLGWLAWIVLGGMAGWISSILTKNNARMGLLANILVGIAGGFIGGFLMNLIGARGVTGFNLWSLLVAVIGASILLWIIGLVRRR
jgi:uncharacterized membrane protein YeaQ/YmgE (transglycosylase-associated protein family)